MSINESSLIYSIHLIIITTREIYILPQNAKANSEAQVIAHRQNAQPAS